MKAEIIAVGTEILLGDIVNTNAQFLSKELAKLGIEVYRQEVVGDNEIRLLEVLDEALKRSDLVITTGGLGPTQDDLTKETVCKYFNMKPVLHEESHKILKEMFNRLERKLTENNLKQVYFPKEAIVLANPNGTAPGALFKKGIKMVAVLPGPPKEMKPMFNNELKKHIKDLGDGIIVSRVIRVLGLGESAAADKLRQFIDNGINPTVAPYAKDDDVILRITAKADTEEEATKLIEPVANSVKNQLGLDYYGEGADTTIEQVVCKMLIERELKIATAESCTGGMIASRLVSYPGISDVFLEGAVTYSNEAKIRTLNVKNETLENYGAVSEQTAMEMAFGIADRAGADISVVTTGIAGPGGGTEDKPVGLVYIGVYYKGEASVEKCIFNGDRDKVRTRATITALDMVRREILKK
jgi:nicotinamide-nucleotide amidase